MPTTVFPPRITTGNVYRDIRPGEPIGDFNWRPIKEWRVTPGDDGGTAWHVAADVDVDVDGFNGETAAVQGVVRLRMSDGTTSTPAVVAGPVSRVQVGYAPIPDFPTSTTVILEIKQTLGNNTESLAVGRAELLVVSSPSVAEIGGPTYPPGVTAPSPNLLWSAAIFPPSGATWTDFNTQVETLTLVGGPPSSPAGIVLTAGQHVTGAPLPQPDDTFDITLDLTTPTPTVSGNRFFTTRTGTTLADVGVHLRWIDAAGGVQLRFSDGTNDVVSPSVASSVGRHRYRIVKTASTVDLYIDGTQVLSETRPVAVIPFAGGDFRIGVASDLTVHGVTIVDGN